MNTEPCTLYGVSLSQLAALGTFLQGIAAIMLAVGGAFAWIQYRRTKGVQSARWLNELSLRFYQLDKIDTDLRRAFEYEFFETMAPAMERWIVCPHRLRPEDQAALAKVDGVLNFFEIVCHVSERDRFLHAADREAVFQFWFDDLMRQAASHAILRLYLHFGFEKLRARAKFPVAHNYIAVYGTLMQSVQTLIADQELREKAASAREQIGKFVGPCVIPGSLIDLGKYPGLVLGGEASVKGELYELPFGGFGSDALDRFRRQIAALDRFEEIDEEHPAASEYTRRYVLLREPRDTAAWVYIVNAKVDSPGALPIASGDWRIWSTAKAATSQAASAPGTPAIGSPQ